MTVMTWGRDGNQVWGRVVQDIPDFCRELITALSEAQAESRPCVGTDPVHYTRL